MEVDRYRRLNVLMGILGAGGTAFLFYLAVKSLFGLVQYATSPAYRAMLEAKANTDAAQYVLRQEALTAFMAGGLLVLLVGLAYVALAGGRLLWRRGNFVRPISVEAGGTFAYPALYENGRVRQLLSADAQSALPAPDSILSIYDVPKPEGLAIPIGRDCDGGEIAFPIDNAAPWLIAGSPGGGKTNQLASILASIGRFWPDGRTVKAAILDPKGVDFYDLPRLPFLYGSVANNQDDAYDLFGELLGEMERRTGLFQRARRPNLNAYRATGGEEPYLLVLVDEVWMLSDEGPQVKKERFLKQARKLAAAGRAYGILPIFATQRPAARVVSKDITGLAGSFLCFPVASSVESKIVLGRGGAEKLERPGEFMAKIGGRQLEGQSYFADVENKFYPFLAQLGAGNVIDGTARQLEAPPVTGPQVALSAGSAPEPPPVPVSIPDGVPIKPPIDRKPKVGGETLYLFERWQALGSYNAVVADHYPRTDGKPGGQKGGQAFKWVRWACDVEEVKRHLRKPWEVRKVESD